MTREEKIKDIFQKFKGSFSPDFEKIFFQITMEHIREVEEEAYLKGFGDGQEDMKIRKEPRTILDIPPLEGTKTTLNEIIEAEKRGCEKGKIEYAEECAKIIAEAIRKRGEK